MRALVLALVLAWGALPCLAQTDTLRVFSEFTRIDPFGEIVAQDRGSAEPRHILSPGVPRNAFSSLRIVVMLEKPGKYILDIGQNPENAVKATLYKEQFEKHGDHWIPDGLEAVKIPYEAIFAEDKIPGQRAVTFWLDMWVDRDAPVDRIKVEPQVWVSYADDWFTYPMEVRILDAQIPSTNLKSAALPPVTARSDAAVLGPLRAAYCGKAEASGPAATNVRSQIRRNALQHLAAPANDGAQKLAKVANVATVQSWCLVTGGPRSGPEWYLRFRDLLLQKELR